MIATYEITPRLAEEFTTGVRWLQANGRPDLTPAAALAEALEDWIAALRAEHLRGEEIPRDTTASRVAPATSSPSDRCPR
ncbi:MAG: hypothetical protein ACRDZ1_10790 [Acidimicrobiia bacterium]